MTFSDYLSARQSGSEFIPDFYDPAEQVFAACFDSIAALLRVGVLDVGGDPCSAIVPGFIDKMTPNAFADHVEGVHYIAMHQAHLVTMMDFALFAFTQSAFLPMIGDAAGEDSPPPLGGEAPGLFLLARAISFKRQAELPLRLPRAGSVYHDGDLRGNLVDVVDTLETLCYLSSAFLGCVWTTPV